MDVFLDARRDGSVAPGRQLAPQELDRIAALTPRVHNESLRFDRSAERQRQMRLGVELSLRELCDGELSRFDGVRVGAIVLLRRERAAPEPRNGLYQFRRDRLITNKRFASLEISLRDRGANLADNVLRRGDAEGQKHDERNPSPHDNTL